MTRKGEGLKYEHWVDALKGIAIILVIAGHCNLPVYLTNFIYFFHMPLFFFLSGYLEKDKGRSLVEHVGNRAKRLIYPYAAFGLLIIAYNTIVYHNTVGNLSTGLIKRFVALLYGNYIFENNYAYIGVLWFLVASFCVSVLFKFFHGTRHKVLYTVMVISIGLILCQLEKMLGIRMPWCLDIALVAFGFSTVGYLMRKCFVVEIAQRKLAALGIILLVIGIISGCLNLWYMNVAEFELRRTDMLYLNWGSIVLFFSTGIALSISFSFFVKLFYKDRRCLILEWIGKNSLIIMAVHLYIMQIIRQIMYKIIGGQEWLIFVIATVASILASLIINQFFPMLYDYEKMRSFLHSNKRRGKDGAERADRVD